MAAIALQAARHRPELEPLAPAVVSAAIPASFIDVDIENRGNPLIALAVGARQWIARVLARLRS